jgi:hypothetical protein
MLSKSSPRLANASRSTPIAEPSFVVAIGALGLARAKNGADSLRACDFLVFHKIRC